MPHVVYPSAVYQSKLDRIAVFVIGYENRHLYDKYWNGSKWVWEDQGLPTGTLNVGHASAVYQTTLDRIVVFTVGTSGHLYDKYWNGNAWVWEDQGLPAGETHLDLGPPSAVYQSKLDRIVVFTVGTSGHLYDKYWNGNAWVWEDQGLPAGNWAVGYASAVYQSKLDRIVVFTMGTSGHLYDKYWNGNAWVWEDQGLPPGTNLSGGFSLGVLSPVYQSKLDRIVVFVIGANGHLLDKYWDGSKWVWEDQGTP